MSSTSCPRAVTARWLVLVWVASLAMWVGYIRLESVMQPITPDVPMAGRAILCVGAILLLGVSCAAYAGRGRLFQAGAVFLLGYWLCFLVAEAGSIFLRLGSMMVPSPW
jgi:hypothetical protein